MWAKWSSLEFNQRFALGSLFLFLLVMPIALYLAFSPTSPFSKAGPGCTISAPGCGEEVPASLSIEPSNISVAPGGTFVADIMLDTGSHEVTAAEIVLTFDQELLEASGSSVIVGDFLPVTLEEPTLLGNSYSGADSYRSASLRFVVGSDAETPVSGYGKIATVKFAAQYNEGSSSLSLAEGSQVAAIYRQENVSSETYPAKVTIAKSSSAGQSIDFRVKLEGVDTILPTPNPNSSPKPVLKLIVPMTLEVESATDSAKISTHSAEFIAKDSGYYEGTFTDVPANFLYRELYIKGPRHLRKHAGTSPFPVEKETDRSRITLYESLVAGDIINNNAIDIFDYNIIVQDFGLRMPSGGSQADLDFDGDVDIFDYNLVIQNFGTVGD